MLAIHKKLGWGLTDLKHDREGHIIDPRINANALTKRPGAFGEHYLNYLQSLREAEQIYDEWNDLSLAINNVANAARGGQELPWPITHEPSSGRPDLLLVQPVGFPKWSRYDDVMDYSEESMLHDPSKPRVMDMPDGIFPFSHTLMSAIDGRPVDDSAHRMIKRMMQHPDFETDPKYRAAADHLAKVSKFKDAEHAIKNTVTAVPADIRYVCSWTGIFTEEETWIQLRPMLYTYWA